LLDPHIHPLKKDGFAGSSPAMTKEKARIAPGLLRFVTD